ncbi:STAS domain-containing protein [Marinactinospora thermotolerans]|uniref:RsbT co-antagonist protein RsbR n=1 Tax=Marinactinospora thermotolerans DSM 45154 TaxID=1122192 RepID=A0A1T4T4M7_9ACTN|nr:STAS domain-containing protein [Marinactinospora thermotolerans]SKA35413.1 rsbT co-antagonist protein RsbR [Marinactinospora thermotolerans DSM 45154]
MTHPPTFADPEIAGLLRENKQRLLDDWSREVALCLRGSLEPEEIREDLAELLQAMIAAMDEGADETTTGELRALLEELSRRRARQDFRPSETATSVFAIKDVVRALLGPAPAYETLERFFGFSRFVDELALITYDSYVNAREQVIIDQAEQLLELSTPVVKLWEGVVAVPLVGTLDSARTQVVMEKMLQTLVETGSEYAVIDITGVSAVDTQVAQHLIKTVAAARLMGAECVISGIRPQIAHTIVTLGIEFSDIVTKASLADALAYALRRSGVEIVRLPEETQ